MSKDTGCIEQDAIITSDQKVFDLRHPTPEDIDIQVIAFALSKICRFTGHTPFYSVAEHSVYVSRILPQHLALSGLLHDAAEAYLGDVSRPVKSMISGFHAIEDRIQDAIFTRYGLVNDQAARDKIKTADNMLLKCEMDTFFPNADIAIDWSNTPDCKWSWKKEMYPITAASLFLHEFEVLCATPK